MIKELKTNEEITAAISEDCLVLITRPINCPPCRMLEAAMNLRPPTRDLYIVDIGKYQITHSILEGLKRVPTLLEYKNGQREIVKQIEETLWRKA